MPIQLVLADDHPIVLAGLEQLLSLEEDFRVLAKCTDGEQAMHALRAHRPDVLVLDLKMPKMDGLAVLRALGAEHLPTQPVILTASLGEYDLLEAVRLGARGIVLKEMASDQLVTCIRTVSAGGQSMDADVIVQALNRLAQRGAPAQRNDDALTPRELEIVRMVARSLRNKVIARELGLTEGTVKIHLHNIYEKLGIESRTELALYARDKGLI